MARRTSPGPGAAAFGRYRAYGIPVLGALTITAAFAVFSSPATGVPEYLNRFNDQYDTGGTKLDSCQTCHTGSSGNRQNVNPYGLDFERSNHEFGPIESLDSDGDGHTNIDEIKAATFPGDPKDFPGSEPPPPPKPAPTTTTTAPGLIPGLPKLP